MQWRWSQENKNQNYNSYNFRNLVFIKTTESTPATEKTNTTIPPRKTPELLISGRGDKASFCFLRETFNPSQHCSKYGHICIRSCGRCRGSEQEKCSNLKDRTLDCSRINCQDPDRMTRLLLL
eukprot:TCONS_00045217-protein